MIKRFRFTTIKSSLFREDLGGYQLFSDSKVETHPLPLPNHGGEKRVAFTLAEVLITLAIIGVVAAMTIPTLIANYNQKSWDTATSVFNRRLGEALKIMNANGSLAGYNSTEDFVTELSKHIKIVKTCDNTNLTDCFVSEISTGQDSVKTEEIKKSKNLYSTEDYGTDTMGVMFADGTSALIAYNPNTPYDPYSNKIVSVNGDGKSASLDTEAISILYDVNGLKSPNEYGTGKDIKGLNIKLSVIPKVCANGVCVSNLGTDYKAIDCSSAGASSDDYKYCTDGDKQSVYTNNYWAGAKKKCAELGMSLPKRGSVSGNYCSSDAAENTLCGLYNNREALGLPSSGVFWSASENDTDNAWFVDFSNGRVYTGYGKTNLYSVVCVGN